MRHRLVATGVIVLLACCVPRLYAGEVEDAKVTQKQGRYSLDLTMRIDSDPAAVHALVSDYANLERISDIIIDSELLDGADGDRPRRRVETETCILFFCFTATLVEDVIEAEDRAIRTTVVPALSDYRYGESLWQISAAGGGTRIHFTATLEPDFWIPPVIGTWAMKRTMRTEAEDTILKVEQLTRHD